MEGHYSVQLLQSLCLAHSIASPGRQPLPAGTAAVYINYLCSHSRYMYIWQLTHMYYMQQHVKYVHVGTCVV